MGQHRILYGVAVAVVRDGSSEQAAEMLRAVLGGADDPTDITLAAAGRSDLDDIMKGHLRRFTHQLEAKIAEVAVGPALIEELARSKRLSTLRTLVARDELPASAAEILARQHRHPDIASAACSKPGVSTDARLSWLRANVEAGTVDELRSIGAWCNVDDEFAATVLGGILAFWAIRSLWWGTAPEVGAAHVLAQRVGTAHGEAAAILRWAIEAASTGTLGEWVRSANPATAELFTAVIERVEREQAGDVDENGNLVRSSRTLNLVERVLVPAVGKPHRNRGRVWCAPACERAAVSTIRVFRDAAWRAPQLDRDLRRRITFGASEDSGSVAENPALEPDEITALLERLDDRDIVALASAPELTVGQMAHIARRAPIHVVRLVAAQLEPGGQLHPTWLTREVSVAVLEALRSPDIRPPGIWTSWLAAVLERYPDLTTAALEVARRNDRVDDSVAQVIALHLLDSGAALDVFANLIDDWDDSVGALVEASAALGSRHG